MTSFLNGFLIFVVLVALLEGYLIIRCLHIIQKFQEELRGQPQLLSERMKNWNKK